MAIGQVLETGMNPMYGHNIQRTINKMQNEEQYVKMRNLVNKYNEDPDKFTDEEAEKVALIAKTIGLPFTRETKPLKNLLYGAAEGISFGLVPDSWRPEERGESVYGRSDANKFWSGLGMVGGGAAGIGLGGWAIGGAGRAATGLGSKILGGVRGSGGAATGMASRGMAGARGAAQTGYTGAQNFAGGVRAGYANPGARRIGAPGTDVMGPGFVMNPNPAIGVAEGYGMGLGGALNTGVGAAGTYATRLTAWANPYVKAADARARSMYYNSRFYGGVPQQQTGLMSFV